jgi:hypothetical protein
MANRTVTIIVCLAAISVTALGAAGIATAQNNPPPSPAPIVTDSQAQGRPEAPVGHRQPRPQDLPQDGQNAPVRVAPAELDLNKKLEICRGC